MSVDAVPETPMAVDAASLEEVLSPTTLVLRASNPAELLNFRDLCGFLHLVESTLGTEGQLNTLMQDLPPENHESFWARALQAGEEYLKREHMLQAVQAVEGGAPSDEAAVALRTVGATAELLASFADNALDATRCAVLPPSFLQVAINCQELLLAIPDSRIQSLVAHALEKVCTGAFEGREEFYGGVLMFLIGRCLEPKMTHADVTRLYKMRALLLELDWEHQSIDSLKLQLMRCAANPHFLKAPHGADMVAHFYTLHPGFTAEVNATVKNQVLFSRPQVLKAYATALYKAWKASEAGTRVQIEHCIQEWIVLAVRAGKKPAEKARHLLEEMHRHRLEANTGDLLSNLYAPVLWRSLKVANQQVRENAARLLQYVLPLIPSDLGVADAEHELIRQLRMLRETLEDPSEPVRRVGVTATCIILKNYWDALPPSEVAELLTVLMNKCAHDKKAPLVRAAVADGFGWILDNALSHPTMAAVLPQAAELLNDKSPMVRAAFVHLLSRLSHCRGISVHQVVNNEALLLRLASEHTEGQAERLQRGVQPNAKKGSAAEARASPELVARHLSHLMAPSLFQHDLPEQVARCQYLMKHWPLALLALLSHMRDIVPPPSRVKLAAALFHFGLKDASSPEDTAQPKMVATMLRVVGVLLEGSVEPSKKKGKKGKDDKFPVELERFVYEHICEADFVHLLRVPKDDTGAAARLREDLLYAVSSLDPARLPLTAEAVRHELELMCRGAATASTQTRAVPRLATLMRTAVRWNIAGSALEPAWERLTAGATRLRLRQPTAEDMLSAVTVVEVACQDPDVRAPILLQAARALSDIVEAIAGAFSNAWTIGLAELKHAAEEDPLLLGVAADDWPRVIGLVVRLALHLEHRVGPKVSPSGEPQDAIGDSSIARPEESAIEDATPAGALDSIDQVVASVTGAQALEALRSVEALAAQRNEDGESRPAKRSRGSVSLPADIDAVLQVHERLLEFMSVANLLSVLKANKAGAKEAGPGAASGSESLARTLEDVIWRWAAAADAIRPCEKGTRLQWTWSFLGRLLQQAAHCDMPTPDVMGALRRQLERATDEVAENEEEVKKVLQTIFARFEYEPTLVSLISGFVDRPADETREGAHGDSVAEAPENQAGSDPSLGQKTLRKVITELVPNFRNLRFQLMPWMEPKEERRPFRTFTQDPRRILASPSPLKALAGAEARQRQEPEEAGARVSRVSRASRSEIDGESVTDDNTENNTDARSCHSFSVQSQSPPTRRTGCSPDSLDSLFKSALSQPNQSSAGTPLGRRLGSVASVASVGSVASACDGDIAVEEIERPSPKLDWS